MLKPKVTVFMAVFNGEKFIRQAINSILKQTFNDFELLLVDDGSTDNSVSIIREYSDDRIRLLQNETNLGLFLTRNRGIEEARGKYFATLDCDDIATKRRLELQMKYFQQNKKAAVCAGRVIYIDNHSRRIGTRSPLSGDQDYYKALLLFTNIFINSAAMIDMNVLKKFKYRIGYEPAEDYDLFERIAAEYEIGIINDFVCNYRIHSGNVSIIKSRNRKIGERVIIERQLRRYGFEYDEDDLNTHLKFTSAEFDHLYINECLSWFNKLAKQNNIKKSLNDNSFKLALAKQWIRFCLYRFRKKHEIKPLFARGPFKYSHLLTSFIKAL
ncbi:MAG TPA: glycosyltransferase family 2 protein [Chitinophagaceae bacterium]|jgi:glycosyltransferase involved in cell wall biosynthesis